MLGSIALMALVVFAIVTHSRLNKLQEEIDQLKRRRAVTSGESVFSQASIKADMGAQPALAASAPSHPTITEKAPPQPSSMVPKLQPKPAADTKRTKSPSGPSFEERFGAQLPIWVGGIALAFGGFFLVRYSVEAGLIGPGMRVILALLFGLTLVGAAFRFGPGNMRMGQSLAGAGIAVLYASVYMASSFYNLVPSTLGFIGMIATTIGAVVMALRYGPPIALMGFAGALLTPIMVGGNGSTALLLIYLYLTLSGFLFIARRNNWHWISYLVAPVMIVWALVVAFFIATPAELPFLGAFLLAVYLTFAKLNHSKTDSGYALSHAVQNLITTIGITTLMGTVLALSGYKPSMQVMFYLLILAALALRVMQNNIYKIAPWLALGLGLFALVDMPASRMLLPLNMMIVALITPFIGVSFWRAKRGPEGESFGWVLLGSIAALAFYGTVYLRYGYAGERVELWPFVLPLLWGGLGLLGMTLFTIAAQQLNSRSWQDEKNRQYALGTLASTATAFLSFGMAIEITALPIHHAASGYLLCMALAGQMLALALINLKAKLMVLRPLIGTLGTVALFTYGLAQISGHYSTPALDLGILLALLIGLRTALLKGHDGKLVHCVEVASFALSIQLGWKLVSLILPTNMPMAYWHYGLNLSVLAGLGFAALLWAIKKERVVMRYASMMALSLAAIAVVVEMTFNNPVLSPYAFVGDLPLFNALLVLYLVPSLALYKAGERLIKLDNALTAQTGKAEKRDIYLVGYALRLTALLAGFAFINLSVRHLFHGGFLGADQTSNIELYSYSFLWLLMGIGLLVLGTMRQHKPLRIASLILMIVTVGKVFLIDAAALEGLLRVLSFMGLGVALMGLGWFYKRFIFTRDEV